MRVLITLRKIRLKGEIIQPGEMIHATDEQGLIDKGYARPLNEDEAQAILGQYISYADFIFNKPKEASVVVWKKRGNPNASQGSLW